MLTDIELVQRVAERARLWAQQALINYAHSVVRGDRMQMALHDFEFRLFHADYIDALCWIEAHR